jgi:hypothetical protein
MARLTEYVSELRVNASRHALMIAFHRFSRFRLVMADNTWFMKRSVQIRFRMVKSVVLFRLVMADNTFCYVVMKHVCKIHPPWFSVSGTFTWGLQKHTQIKHFEHSGLRILRSDSRLWRVMMALFDSERSLTNAWIWIDVQWGWRPLGAIGRHDGLTLATTKVEYVA